jgi:hypothetical protein
VTTTVQIKVAEGFIDEGWDAFLSSGHGDADWVRVLAANRRRVVGGQSHAVPQPGRTAMTASDTTFANNQVASCIQDAVNHEGDSQATARDLGQGAVWALIGIGCALDRLAAAAGADDAGSGVSQFFASSFRRTSVSSPAACSARP